MAGAWADRVKSSRCSGGILPRRLFDGNIHELYARHLAGESLLAIEKSIGWSRITIANAFRNAGLEPRSLVEAVKLAAKRPRKSISEEGRANIGRGRRGKHTGHYPVNAFRKGQRASPATEFFKGQIPWNKGKRNKMAAEKIRKPRSISAETREKINRTLRSRFTECTICGRECRTKYCQACKREKARIDSINYHRRLGMKPMRKFDGDVQSLYARHIAGESILAISKTIPWSRSTITREFLKAGLAA